MVSRDEMTYCLHCTSPMHTASGDSAVVAALARFRVALSRDYFVQAYFAQKITFWVYQLVARELGALGNFQVGLHAPVG